MQANLLVTYDPSRIGKAKAEVQELLKEVDEEAEFLDSKTDGLFLLKVENAKHAVKKLRSICRDEKEKFECTFKWVPIEKWTSSQINDMAKALKDIEERIGDDEKWKMDLTKRHYDSMSTTELIMKLTENIEKPNVDLKNPDKIVKVEIIGENAGISLLDADEFLDVQKMK
ncbi:MAG TPA: THUMP domain-containing protein [archaeon]|nr:THUMP domain-containing protein [archaeon]